MGAPVPQPLRARSSPSQMLSGFWPKRALLTSPPLRDSVAAVSIGMIGKQVYLDLNYEEDSRADVDMNFVMTGSGGLVEVQGTAERTPFRESDLKRMTAAARKAILQLTRLQRKSIGKTKGLGI